MSLCISRSHNKVIIILKHYNMNKFVSLFWCDGVPEQISPRPGLWQHLALCPFSESYYILKLFAMSVS